MHEDVIPRSEDNINRIHIRQDESNHDLSGNAKIHVEVMHSLRKDRLSSGLADDVIEKLADEVAVEVTRLRVFYGLGGEANWSVGVGRDLLDIAGRVFEEIAEVKS